MKARPEPGIWMEQVPVPEPGPRRADQGQEDRDLRHRRAYLQLGRWSARSRAGADGDRPRILRRDRRFRRGRDQIQDRPAGVGRGPYRLRPLPQLPRGRGHLCRNTLGVGVNRPGAFAEYLCLPETMWCRSPTTFPTRSRRSSTRSAMPCTPRSAFDLVGEDVLVTGAGPIGIMGALVAQRVGARKVVITDINPTDSQLAKTTGRSARGRCRRKKILPTSCASSA